MFSEEGSEACNKLIRNFREHLDRQTSFEDNIVDIFVRLASEIDPVLVEYRSKLVCDQYGVNGHTKRKQCCNNEDTVDKSIDSLIHSHLLKNTNNYA